MGNKTAKDDHYENRTFLFIGDVLNGNYECNRCENFNALEQIASAC